MTLSKKLSLSIALLSLAAGPVWAQVAGTILGTITDSSGAAVAGVQIEVRNVGTGASSAYSSDAQGRYRAPELGLGEYEVTASKVGFSSTVRRGIAITVGSQNVVDMELRVGQQNQTVTVEGAVTQVETTNAAVANLVEQAQMRELPLNGRSFTQLLTLAPGVTQINVGGTGFYGGANVSVAGSRAEGQAFLLDNTNINGFWNKSAGSGALGTSLGVEAIAEFQALTANYSTQFGGNGAVVNAISKSGTNTLHGSVYHFLRNDNLDARNFFDPKNQPEFHRNQFGGSIGGPLIKDKAFFFANYEGLRQAQGVTRVALVPDDDARRGLIGTQQVAINPLVQPFLDIYPRATRVRGAGVGELDVTRSQVGRENYFLGRMDYILSQKDSLFGRFVVDRADFLEPFSGGNLGLWPAQTLTRNFYATIEEKRVISPTLINLARVSFVRPTESAEILGSRDALQIFGRAAGRQDAVVNVGGLTSIGSQQTFPFYFRPNRLSVADDILWTKGAHNLSMGGSVLRMKDNLWGPFTDGGNFTFPNLQTFLLGTPSTFVASLPTQRDAVRDMRQTLFTLYFNDQWKLSQRLTLTLGARYEPSTQMTEARNKLNTIIDPRTAPGFLPVATVFDKNPSRTNIAPRFGFAYDPFNDHKTSIRGGFGIFLNTLVDRSMMPMYWLNKPFVTNQVTNPTGFPTPFAAGLGSLPINIPNGLDYAGVSTPYMMQYNFSVQRELPGKTLLTLGYVGSRGVHLWAGADANVAPRIVDGVRRFALPAAPGSNNAVPFRINPAFGNVNWSGTNGNSNYNSMQISANRRLSNNLQWQASYTWSKSPDTGSAPSGLEGFGAGGIYWQDPYNAKADYGRSTFDRRHNFRLSGLYQLPFKGNLAVTGWSVSGIFSAVSGSPFTPQSGVDRIGTQSSGGGNPGRANWTGACSRDQLYNFGQDPVVRWYNPGCFTVPDIGVPGNAGRNTLVGPQLSNLDFSVLKNTKITKVSETFEVQFRAETFNLLNHANFALPTTAVFAGSAVNAQAGRITATSVANRQVQLAIKVLF